MDPSTLVPQILTPFNFVDWREDIQVSLCKFGSFRMRMGRETQPHHPTEKNKFLNQLDEAFGFLCTHISQDLLFHLQELKTQKDYWENIETLFGKQYELQGHVLENYLIALHPNSFETIQQFLTKFKSLALQCKQCGIERKYEKLVPSLLSKIGLEYYVFFFTFHSRSASIPNWKMPSLDAFVEFLIQEQDKFVQMRVVQNSKNQALLMSY